MGEKCDSHPQAVTDQHLQKNTLYYSKHLFHFHTNCITFSADKATELGRVFFKGNSGLTKS